MGKAKWSSCTVRSILTNEKYKGDALLQKTYVVDCISHKSKKNDDRPQYYVENSHPPIIPRAMFDRVQEELVRRNNKRKVKQ
ncbi:MAG: recombinase family protein, partial [bacterium]